MNEINDGRNPEIQYYKQMKELIKDLENCLIECRNPILSNMDQDCDRKTENDIVEPLSP